jgi:HEXXH motif-containing protein
MFEQEVKELAGFSGPQLGVDDELLDVIAVDHARNVVGNLTERHGRELDERAPGLASFLATWASSADERFDTVWSPAFGDLHALLMSESQADAVRASAAAGLRLLECGHAGEWAARLPATSHFRFGRWLLPACDELAVATAGDEVTIRTRSAAGAWQEHALTRDPRAPGVIESRAALEALPLVERRGLRFTLARAEALSTSGAERLLSADAYEFGRDEVAIDDEWRRTLDAAIDLMHDIDGSYVTWVGRVLRDLIPLRARPRTFNSGSERFSPGVICVSDQCFRWPLAEMLVHEATHQYLHLVNRLGPLDDGSDPQLYFSPFRQKDRPIFYIVVAYHAFANVLLFYRTARSRGLVPEQVITTDTFARREDTLARQLAEIEGPLSRCTALTPLGRALWEPLRDAVHA